MVRTRIFDAGDEDPFFGGLRALANRTDRRVLVALTDRPATVAEIVRLSRCSESAVRRALRDLLRDGLICRVSSERTKARFELEAHLGVRADAAFTEFEIKTKGRRPSRVIVKFSNAEI